MTTQKLDAQRDTAVKPILVALAAASARLAVLGAIGAWLFILVLNEIAAAFVYTLAALLALFVWSCPG